MKKSFSRIAIGLAVVGAVLLVGPTTKSKPEVFAESDSCSLRSLGATYGFAFSGYVNTGAPANFTPVSAAGTMAFRPDGTLTRSFNVSFGGSIFPVSDHGTYSLNSDCTFTASLPMAGETWDLITVDQGKQIEFFVNTAGRVGAGTLTRQ
jgi:hypothetical protein